MSDGSIASGSAAKAFSAASGTAQRPGPGGALAAARSAIGITFHDPSLEEAIRATLTGVEGDLHEAVAAADPVLGDAARHLVDAGGKRFRPLLVALAAQFGDPGRTLVRRAAVVVELTHLATLYHDDVMDEAPVRRGSASANARWGNAIAILTGDYLFARAADIAADLGTEAVRIQARTFARLVHGQIAETVGPRDGDPVRHYLRVITDKTGSLIGTSARFGAMFSGAPSSTVEAMAAYGDTIGVAFQLSDDVLDIASETRESGKTPGTDLREGVPTLPVLYALADDATDASAVRLREILRGDVRARNERGGAEATQAPFRGPMTDEALVDEALELLRDSAALKRAQETVRGYAERARGGLAALPDLPARRALESLADFIADRSA